MKTSSTPTSVLSLGLTDSELHDIESLNCNFVKAYHDQDVKTSKDSVLRKYVEVKLRIVDRGLRFGIVNNRIFIGVDELLIPYILGNTILIFHATNEESNLINSQVVRDGTIITDLLINKITPFKGEVLDLEYELFELDVTRCESVRIGHIRDMANQLEKISKSANLTDATYLLRSLVAQTSLLSFKEYLSAKNLQVEVRRLYGQLLNFLNSPLSYRLPFLIRILVRNISSVVSKPKLIDRLWNDTIDLAEVHLRGSQIVNEIRRSTHHAIGKRTLSTVKNYLDFLETGNFEGLKELGYSEPSQADLDARQKEHPKKIVTRILNDLQELLGSTDAIGRIRDWQARYTAVLSQCESDESIISEMEHAVADGLKDQNQWMFYHHIRIMRNRVSQFTRLEFARTTEDKLNRMLEVDPEKPDFDEAVVEINLRQCINDFVAKVESEYQESLIQSLEDLITAFQNKEFFNSFVKSCDLRKNLRTDLIESSFPEQRLLSYELDCLLEEISFLAIRHIAGSYEEKGIDLQECLTIISSCALNLTHDGLHSRQLLDLVGMLENRSYTFAEFINVLQQVRRNYQHILHQLVAPFERMQDRLRVDKKELHIALANMQRFLHDLNSMAALADTALAHIEQQIGNTNDRIEDHPTEDSTSYENDGVIHLSHSDKIQKMVQNTDPHFNMRALYGGKGSGLIYIRYLNIPTPDGFIVPTTIAKDFSHNRNNAKLNKIIRKHLALFEEDIKSSQGKPRQYGNPDNPLLLAIRGGSVFSMPGILGTVLFVGMNDEITESMAKTDPWHAYDSYRRFLASFGQAAWDIDVEKYDLVEKAKTRVDVKYKDAMPWESMREVVEATKDVFRNEGFGKQLDECLNDPYVQLSTAVCAVIDSWDHPTAVKYRELKSICNNWNTAVVVQEMSSGNRRNENIEIGMNESEASLTGVIPRSQVTELGVRKCTGEFKFSACGEDLVRGLTTSKSFMPFTELNSYMPMLDRRLHHKVARLRSFMGTDQEIEFTVDSGILSILQSRAAEIGTNKAINAFVEPGESSTRGLGIRGSAFRGLVAFDEDDLNQLHKTDISNREDVDGVLMVLENPTPADIPMILLAEGLLASKGGSTSHAAVAINSIENKDYSAVMSSNRLKVNAERHEAIVVDSDDNQIAVIKTGDVVSIHGSTGMVYIGSKPISRNGQ